MAVTVDDGAKSVTSTSNAIEVERLTKRYGPRTAVSEVSFHVGSGEVVGFLGPNGAGKSTTLRMLTGFLAPSSGSIRIHGIDALARPMEAKKLIGYMPEACPLYPELRVHEYLKYRAELKGARGKRVHDEVERAIVDASVGEAKDRIIGQLSKGTRQRVGLADALLGDPPILVLDEPTAGLDPNQIRQVRELIRRLSKRKTVLLSTHILPEVEAVCERVVIIHRGSVIREDATGALRSVRLEGHVRLTLEGRGTVEAFQSALAALPEVRVTSSQALGDQHARLEVRGEGDDLGERVFRAIADAKLTLRELHGSREGSLEEVFSSLTTDEPASSAEPEVQA